MNPPTTHKGRGALSNPEGRFETTRKHAEDDGWNTPPDEEDEPAPIETLLRPDPTRSIITHNQSPDIPFSQSINPYKGCEHGCIYCLDGATPILMADGKTRALSEIAVGDDIYGTQREGWYRHYVHTPVLAHWRVEKPAYRLTLEGGTQLIAGADHRFLTDRGWKFVTSAVTGRRPHLTVNNKLMGLGRFTPAETGDADYNRGYLCGIIRGDGHVGEYHYQNRARHDTQHHFRLAMVDEPALERAGAYLGSAGVSTRCFQFKEASIRHQAMQGIRTHSRVAVDKVRSFIAWPESPTRSWRRGFLAGIFDAEGNYSQGNLRISNTDSAIIECIEHCLSTLGFSWVVERPTGIRNRPISVVRLRGGLAEHLRFFHCTDPAISRTRDITGNAVKSSAALRLVAIEAIGIRPLYDISTGTGDFIADGVVSHNCYARPSHAYLNLSPGLDFETKIFFKDRAAELLDLELRRPNYRPQTITLGANTDPYQPAERKLTITRSILEVLERFRHPVAIITKSALVTRDLDILAAMAERHLVTVMVTLTTLDHSLKRSLEPRAASPEARLRAIETLARAGVPVGVMTAPIIPMVNDAEMERILEKAAAAGACGAGYVLLRLPYELKDLFKEWLTEHYPLKAEHVMSIIRQSRDGKEYDSGFGTRMRGTGRFADLIAQRFHLATKRLSLGFGSRLRLDTAQFRVPPADGQLSLWES